MSLEHEFFLVESDVFDFSDFLKWYDSNLDSYDDKVIIDDTVLLYIMDYIKWVPSFNPSTRTNSEGLNYHGVTLLRKQGCTYSAKFLEH